MPAIIKCTAYFGSNAGRGWSESHYINSGSDTPSLPPFMVNFKTLMENVRRPLLGMDRYIKGYKLSYKALDGGIVSIPWRYTPYMYPVNTKPGCSPSVAAELRMGENTGKLFTSNFLRGFWDAVEQNEQLDFTTTDGAAWKALLDVYVPTLISGGYGWLAQLKLSTSRGNVIGFVTNTDGTVTFDVVSTNGVPLPAGNTKVSLRVARVNGSNSAVNKSFASIVKDPTHIQTLGRVATGPFVTAGTYVVPIQSFVQYTGILYAQLARKPEGKPTIQSPVRKKAAARF